MLKTFLLKNAVASGTTRHMSLQDGGSITGATTSTGWNTGQNGPTTNNQYCSQLGNGEVPRTGNVSPAVSWGSSALPNATPSATIGDCWRTENTYTGEFASGTWSFSFGVRSVTQGYNGRFRLRIKVYRSTDPAGSAFVDLTGSGVTLLTNTTTANLTTSADATLTASWSPAAIPLVGEYLFFQFAIEITSAGSNNNQDVAFRVGPGSGITTPDFSIQLSSALATTAITAPSFSQALTTQLAASAASTELIAETGSTRAYLSWAQLTIPRTAGGALDITLTGQAGATEITAPSIAPRAYLSWAQLRIPQTDNILLGIDQHIASFAGELTPFSGELVQLDGHSAVAEVGTLLQGREIPLTSMLLTSYAGDLLGAEETYALAGTMTPALAFEPALLPMAAGYGSMSVDITDPLQASVPLASALMSSGSTFGGVAMSVQLATRLATTAAGTLTPSVVYGVALVGNEASVTTCSDDAPGLLATNVSVVLTGAGLTIPESNDVFRSLQLATEVGTVLQGDPNVAVQISDRSISITAGSDTDIGLGGRAPTEIILGEIAAGSDSALAVPELGAAAGTLTPIIIATEQSWHAVPAATTIWTDVK